MPLCRAVLAAGGGATETAPALVTFAVLPIAIMGQYLATPNTEKETASGQHERLHYGISAQQGWRKNMVRCWSVQLGGWGGGGGELQRREPGRTVRRVPRQQQHCSACCRRTRT